jgi:hypothetical protein
MRTSVAVLLVAGLVLGAGGVSRADEQADARAIIARAIRARGGEKRLARYKVHTWKEKATYYGMGGSEQYEATRPFTVGLASRKMLTGNDLTSPKWGRS